MIARITGTLLAAFVAASGASGPVLAGTAASQVFCAAHVVADAHGNGLPVLMAKEYLGAVVRGAAGGDGGPQSRLNVRELLRRLDLVQSISSRAQAADVYMNEWRAGYEVGCSSRGGKLSFEIDMFHRLDQRISFSRGLFDFAAGGGEDVAFSATEYAAERRGGAVRLLDIPLAPALALDVEFSFWTIEHFQENSIVFEAENRGTADERWTAVIFGRSSAWDPELHGAPGSFDGSGFAVGAGVSYRPAPWLDASYRIAPIAGREHAAHTLDTSFELDTDTGYIGIGGYLWNHPAMHGKLSWAPYERVLEPEHALELELGSGPVFRAEAGGRFPHVSLRRAGIAFPFGKSGSEFELAWRASTGTVQGVLTLKPLVGRGRGELNLRIGLDNVSVTDAGNASFALEGTLNF